MPTPPTPLAENGTDGSAPHCQATWSSRVTGFGDTVVRNKKSKDTFVSGKKSLGTGVLEQFAPLRASGISSAKSGGKKKKKSSGSSMKMPTSGGTYKMPGGGGGFSMP